MDITWMGRRCFSIRGRDVTILTDPYGNVADRLGKGPKVRAVTCSLEEMDCNLPPDEDKTRRVIRGPGEYETAEVQITGVGTVHGSQGPEAGEVAGGRNTVYSIEIEGIVMCHLGDLQQALTSEQVERLGNVSILMVPVGSLSSLKASTDTIGLMEPRLVVPMDYEAAAIENRDPSQPIMRFLKEMGAQDSEPQRRLHVTPSTLPQETQVAILELAD